jgi:hypothetical protein
MILKTTLTCLLLSGVLYAQPQTIATGLRTPQKLILTPRGNFLVSESNTEINSGRVSFVSRGGARRSLIDGLPSGTSVEGSGSGPAAMALRDRTLYLTIGTGDGERRSEPGKFMHNPLGFSSPIFSSVLAIRFSADVDNIGGTFVLTPALQQRMGDGFEVTLDDGTGTTARLSVLADFPNSNPDPNAIYKFSNPWGLVLTEDGASLFVADASTNSVAKIDTATGRWQRITRFPPTPNPTPVGPPMTDTVPTSIRFYGNDLLVTSLSGFPFIGGAARVFSVNTTTGAFTPFIYNLSSATDILILPTTGPRPIFFTLEFSLSMSATPPGPGRLLRYDTAASTVMSATLPAPVSMVVDESTKSLFVLSLTGVIFEFKI